MEIMLFEKKGNKLSDYDDRSKTKSLSDLNKQYAVNINDPVFKTIDNHFNSLSPAIENAIPLKKKARELYYCFHMMKEQGKL